MRAYQPVVLSPRLGAGALMLVAVVFGANHIAARFAFDHGASVALAVVVRSAFTAMVLLVLVRVQRVAWRASPAERARLLLAGALMATQSYCLYSAVAQIPVALALLAFNTYPMLFVLLSWLIGQEPRSRRALVIMPLALAGLAAALDVVGSSAHVAGRWDEIGSGVAWALAAAVSFALVLLLNAHGPQRLDGRVRTLAMTALSAAIVLAAGAGNLALPDDAVGWTGLVLLSVFYGTAITSLFVLLPRVGAASSTVALNFEPIAVLALAWLLLGQGVKPIQIAGAFVVVGAIAWLNSRRP